MQPPSAEASTDDDLQWLRDAWHRLTLGHPPPPVPVLREALAFLDGVVPRDREEAGVVWLMACRCWPRPAPPFPTDSWIGLVTGDVYAYFEGRGYGARRVLQLLERWARWAHADGRIDRAVMRDLLGDFDYARSLHGFPMKRALEPRPLSEPTASCTLHRFDPDPAVRRSAQLSLSNALAYLDLVQRRPGRLHALDPEGYVLKLRSTLRVVSGDRDPMAPADIVACVGDVYAHLAGTRYLPEPVGRALADRLRRLAAGLR